MQDVSGRFFLASCRGLRQMKPQGETSFQYLSVTLEGNSGGPYKVRWGAIWARSAIVIHSLNWSGSLCFLIFNSFQQMCEAALDHTHVRITSSALVRGRGVTTSLTASVVRMRRPAQINLVNVSCVVSKQAQKHSILTVWPAACKISTYIWDQYKNKNEATRN